eukprot:CAMPEP_0202977030 /NCGR_PEP_ID=MMETSP1396-20130829/82703_1 /ASSEMBLY_ACC=CAM_ASM_000872 /TAXON_ID= /ORGANISM="Pseudokeronopsis sp., Strain Brazil" /LENGTH=54 /DNA_ID=CAMNT_0049715457 /DNA_START=17 /DNA_END=178 /DNA_ORIENTATION=-
MFISRTNNMPDADNNQGEHSNVAKLLVQERHEITFYCPFVHFGFFSPHSCELQV